MFRRNPTLPIDVLIENNTDEQNTPSTYIEKWKSKMKEVFGIAAANTKWRRDMDKKNKWIKKQDCNHLRLVVECWLETLMKKEGLVKEHFGNRKCIKSLKRKIKMV